MKKKYLLDTNVLIRFLIKDNETQVNQIKMWFTNAQNNKISISVTSIVIAETCYVLEAVYSLSRNDIADALQVFISQKWLEVPERKILQNVWQFYLNGFHFVDGYLITKAKDEQISILSFDKKLLKAFSS